jgi:hypothetical protein
VSDRRGRTVPGCEGGAGRLPSAPPRSAARPSTQRRSAGACDPDELAVEPSGVASWRAPRGPSGSLPSRPPAAGGLTRLHAPGTYV